VNVSPGGDPARPPLPDLSLAGLVVLELRLPAPSWRSWSAPRWACRARCCRACCAIPLAEPGLLGVDQRRGRGAVVSSTSASPGVRAGHADAGAGRRHGRGAITFAFGRGGTLTLILAGSAVSGLMAAFLAWRSTSRPAPTPPIEITIWMLGSLSERSWDHIALVAPFIVAGLAILA
jgi:iron complex transport system permease protein